MKIGLALGGGGARGYAHIPVLEAFDDLGIRPHRIAGTSIGAIVGVIYAAGTSGHQLRRQIQEATLWKRDGFRQLVTKRRLGQWFGFFLPEFKRGGFVRSDRVITSILDELGVTTFEDLPTPLRVIATDLWRCQEVVFEEGALAPAVRSSMAIPGVFAPVTHENRLLVDGGLVNLVPHDRLGSDCDLIVAVDVLGLLPEQRCDCPNAVDVLKRTIDLMQYATTERGEARRDPDIFVRADVGRFLISDFHRAEAILEKAEPLRETVRAALEKRLSD